LRSECVTNLHDPSATELEALNERFSDVLNDDMKKVNETPDLQEGLRWYLRADNTVSEFVTMSASERQLSKMVLQTALTALANCLTVQVVEAELSRWQSAGN
jgi:hypothetical protein